MYQQSVNYCYLFLHSYSTKELKNDLLQNTVLRYFDISSVLHGSDLTQELNQ